MGLGSWGGVTLGCLLGVGVGFWWGRPSTPKTVAKAEIPLSPRQQLGKKIFFDRNLSTPPGQSCADCHAPEAGFANPDAELPVSRGVHRDRFGNRNDLPAAYAGFAPPLRWDAKEGAYVGGNFWDGRANDLVAQAKGPFLNKLEMANPDEATVVAKLRAAPYANQFLEVFGLGALGDVAKAYHHAAEALADYQMSKEVAPFSSKYDHYLQGKAQLTESEARGLGIFLDSRKGKCAECHPAQQGPDGRPPLFTDFTYDNLGVPRNPANPFYGLPSDLNPQGAKAVDLGLGGFVKKASEDGKFRVPTLRNVALTRPYMHNGLFRTLRDVIVFYNTRDIHPWPAPEVPRNVNKEELGNLGLSARDIEDLVAFLHTLTDGYRPEPVKR